MRSPLSPNGVFVFSEKSGLFLEGGDLMRRKRLMRTIKGKECDKSSVQYPHYGDSYSTGT